MSPDFVRAFGIMPARGGRRTSGRRQSLAVVPETPGVIVPATPGTAIGSKPEENLSHKINRKVASFYGRELPRPGLMADPDQAAMQVVKLQSGRVQFQQNPLMGAYAPLRLCVRGVTQAHLHDAALHVWLRACGDRRH